MKPAHKPHNWGYYFLTFGKTFILSFFVFAVLLLAAGIHNMDNGQNLRYVNARLAYLNTTMEFSEFTTMGHELSPDAAYFLGFNQAMIGGGLLALYGLIFTIEIMGKRR